MMKRRECQVRGQVNSLVFLSAATGPTQYGKLQPGAAVIPAAQALLSMLNFYLRCKNSSIARAMPRITKDYVAMSEMNEVKTHGG